MEPPLRRLVDAGLSVHEAVRGWTTLYCYVIGFTIEQQAVESRPGQRDQRYDPDRRARRIDAARSPLALAAGEEQFSGFDERFEAGLRLIMAGLEQSLRRSARRRRQRAGATG